MTRVLLRWFAIAGCVLGLSIFSAADQITGSLSGLASPTTTITFEQVGSLVDHSVVTDQYAGVTFGGFGWDAGDLGQAGSTGFSGGNLTNGFFGWPSDTTMSITFATVVNAAVFAAVDQGKTFTIQAYLDGTLVDWMTLPIATNPGAGYIGFSNENFNMITITRSDVAYLSALSIDNLQFISGAITPPNDPPPNDPPPGDNPPPGSDPLPVPEPASIYLFGSGILMLLLSRRQRPA